MEQQAFISAETQPAYPQPMYAQPVYPQPGYPQPVEPQPVQPQEPTPEILDLLGYCKCVSIIALIELVIDCISIVGLIFIYMPICGKRIVNTWKYEDLNCYYIWRMISLIFSCISLVLTFMGDVDDIATALSQSVTSILVSLWIFLVCKKARDLLLKNEHVSPDQLRNWYYSGKASCKCL